MFILPWASNLIQWVRSRWHNPQKVVYMDPYVKDILGVVPSTLKQHEATVLFVSLRHFHVLTHPFPLRTDRSSHRLKASSRASSRDESTVVLVTDRKRGEKRPVPA